jgi:hypothetical protein
MSIWHSVSLSRPTIGDKQEDQGSRQLERRSAMLPARSLNKTISVRSWVWNAAHYAHMVFPVCKMRRRSTCRVGVLVHATCTLRRHRECIATAGNCWMAQAQYVIILANDQLRMRRMKVPREIASHSGANLGDIQYIISTNPSGFYNPEYSSTYSDIVIVSSLSLRHHF